MQEKMTNADRRQKTLAALLSAARELFLEKGYPDTGTTEVVKCADVTRGALYHHFKDKQALFHAVIEMEAKQIAQEIAKRSRSSGTPLQVLLDGTRAYLTTMREPGRIRLMLLDGPAILGPEVMRKIDLESGGMELRDGLAAAMGPEATEEFVAITADLLSAMLERAVLAGSASDYAAYEVVVISLIRRLVG